MTKILLRWACEKKGKKSSIQIRTYDTTKNKTYYIGIRHNQRGVILDHAHAAPYNASQALHLWKPTDFYQTLTQKDAWNSTARVDEMYEATTKEQLIPSEMEEREHCDEAFARFLQYETL